MKFCSEKSYRLRDDVAAGGTTRIQDFKFGHWSPGSTL
jgi:hypothetical protein